jgi:hypothetical protein
VCIFSAMPASLVPASEVLQAQGQRVQGHQQLQGLRLDGQQRRI